MTLINFIYANKIFNVMDQNEKSMIDLFDMVVRVASYIRDGKCDFIISAGVKDWSPQSVRDCFLNLDTSLRTKKKKK